MNLHLNKELFREFIDNIKYKNGNSYQILLKKIIMYAQF